MKFLPLPLLLLFAGQSPADAPQPDIPPSIADTATPALTCVPPVLPEDKQLTAKELKVVDAQIVAYGDCLQHYVDERRAKGAMYIALQKAEVDAGNAAVKIINAFYAQVHDFGQKQHSPPKPKSP